MITTEADVANVVALVTAFDQLDGGTNPGDGINTAMDVLNASGRPTAQQSVCLSTDGLPNAGANTATAVANGRASPIGLDRFGVIAVEDPPFYYAADFTGFYGPLVFGGGGVTVVRNAAEFANLVGATCISPPVNLIGLEVVQAIQDWNNTVQLIRDKATVVRAHVQPPGPDPAVAVARLRGFRGGAELAGSPLSAMNPGGGVVARPNAAARRAVFADSLNFRLPPDWRTGTVELRVEGVGGGVICQEAAGTPNDCAVTVNFVPTDTLEVRWVAVGYPQGGATVRPTAADLLELTGRFVGIYPLANLDSTTGQLGFTTPGEPALQQVNTRLEWMRLFDLCFSILGCDRVYYGALLGAQGGLSNGIPGTVASGTMPANPLVRGRHRHSHEIGHLLGRQHPVDPALGLDPASGLPQGPCGEVADAGTPAFPHLFNIPGLGQRPTLGPMNLGQNSLVYGLDTHRPMVVIDPHQTFELMSYCNGVSLNSGGSRWISSATYDALKASIDNIFAPVPGRPLEARAPAQEYLVVRGTIALASDTVELLPFGRLTSDVAPPSQPAGEYTLEIRNGAGSILSTIDFAPNVHYLDSPDPTPAGFGRPDFGTFMIAVPADPAIRVVRVLRGATALANRTASTSPPTVQVSFPNGGEALTGDEVTLRWIGSDADGDPLTYLVQYSSDDGATWETIAVDLTGTSHEVALRFLEQTTQGRIRVLASDGFHGASDDSDGVFSTPNNAPSVAISAPSPDELFTGVQLVFLTGAAYDLEDGQLGTASLRWASDRDGSLGTGAELTVVASDLSEGFHEITLTATDRKGLASSAKVRIRVARIFVPETCDNCVDDDGNGLADRDDPACTPSADGEGLGVGDPKARGKAVRKCQKAIRVAGAKLVQAIEKGLQSCADAVFACLQEKPADQSCVPKAQPKCAAEHAKLFVGSGSQRASFQSSLAKACGAKRAGDPPLVDLAALLGKRGLGYEAHAGRCRVLGVSGLWSIADIGRCLALEHACRVEQLLEKQMPRARELLHMGGVSG